MSVGSAEASIVVGGRFNGLGLVLGVVEVFSDEAVDADSVDELTVGGVGNESLAGGVCRDGNVRLGG